MGELNQKIATSVSPLAVEDLEKMVESLSAETLPNFLDVCRANSDLAASCLAGIIAQILNRLKDSESSLIICQDAIGSLASIYLKEGNNTGSASSVVALFMEPLLDAMGEENIEVQSGAAMCLARMVDAGAGPLITSFNWFFPRVNELMTSSKFLAKGSLSPIVTCLSQQLPRGKEPQPANKVWIHNFLKRHDVHDDIIEAIETQTPIGRIKRVATQGDIFMQWDVKETRESEETSWRVINRTDPTFAFVTLSAHAIHRYSSVSQQPEQSSSPLYKIPRQLQVMVSNELSDLYKMLRTQAVGANVHYFRPEFEMTGSGIYDGCTSDGSEYMGLYSLIIFAITRVMNKLVAVVKFNHGTGIGFDGGYMYVSLTRMLVGVGYRGSRLVHGLRKGIDVKSPSYLLRDFTYLELPPKPKSESGRSKKKKRKVSD